MDSSTANNVDHEVPALKFSEQNKYFSTNMGRGQSRDILAKNVTLFSSSTENVSEAKLKKKKKTMD